MRANMVTLAGGINYDCCYRYQDEEKIMTSSTQRLWLLKWYEFIPTVGDSIRVWELNLLVVQHKVNIVCNFFFFI